MELDRVCCFVEVVRATIRYTVANFDRPLIVHVVALFVEVQCYFLLASLLVASIALLLSLLILILLLCLSHTFLFNSRKRLVGARKDI